MPLDALVLLGCRVGANTLPPPALRRVARAAEAFGVGLAPRVVVSGGRAWEGYVEADRLAEELVRSGVPEEALILERCSHTTRDNAVRTAAILRREGWRRVGLVTCDFHIARALWSFRHEGFEVEPVIAVSPPAEPLWGALRSAREHGAWILDRARAALW